MDVAEHRRLLVTYLVSLFVTRNYAPGGLQFKLWRLARDDDTIVSYDEVLQFQQHMAHKNALFFASLPLFFLVGGLLALQRKQVANSDIPIKLFNAG